MELALIHSNKINKGTIKVFNTPLYKGIANYVQKMFSMGVLQTKWIIKRYGAPVQSKHIKRML
jgi:hypothetical protein